jgi:hypothetical protein
MLGGNSFSYSSASSLMPQVSPYVFSVSLVTDIRLLSSLRIGRRLLSSALEDWLMEDLLLVYSEIELV